MPEFVVDTNVLLAADDRETPRLATHVPIECRLRALEWLAEALATQATLVIDDHGRILEEYQRKPRYGDYAYDFVREALSSSMFRWVGITFDDDGHAVLPDSLSAVVHDRADRKFVAVALGAETSPPIINCADSDWFAWETALHAHGLSVQHLCGLIHQRRP